MQRAGARAVKHFVAGTVVGNVLLVRYFAEHRVGGTVGEALRDLLDVADDVLGRIEDGIAAHVGTFDVVVHLRHDLVDVPFDRRGIIEQRILIEILLGCRTPTVHFRAVVVNALETLDVRVRIAVFVFRGARGLRSEFGLVHLERLAVAHWEDNRRALHVHRLGNAFGVEFLHKGLRLAADGAHIGFAAQSPAGQSGHARCNERADALLQKTFDVLHAALLSV